MTDLTVATPHGPLPVYLATSSSASPWPAVVVIHDAQGMSEDVRRQADWLASAGFLAAAPDLLTGDGKVRCLLRVTRDALSGTGRSFDEIEALRAWLGGRDDCTGRTGIIGFCMGGGFALLLAPRGQFQVSSVNYGVARRRHSTAEFLENACPIVASFGRKDRTLKGAAARLEAALTGVGVDHDVKEYPDAGHAFLNDHPDDELSLVLKLSSRLIPAGYHEPSADDARRRIVAFFRKHLEDNHRHTDV